jgi:RNA polymerase sigma factor (sigma-70 family)
MLEMTDMELLAQYARSGSEDAFAALVKRHIHLVYSVALRHTGNPHLAEEITQAVFILLARKAKSLSVKTVLSGWLYHTARLTAANQVRAEIRRVQREQEAHMQANLNEPADPRAWEQIAPLLDEAMDQLGQQDRDAVVLRFFENQTALEIAVALKLNEEAAQKHVSRGLEKLRKYFVKRGVALTATVIASAVAANSVSAAPAGLAASVSAAAAKGAAISGSTLTLIKGALKIMAWTKVKTAVVIGVSLLLATGTATIAVKMMAPPAPFIHIAGEAQIILYTKPPQVVGSAKLDILTDGKLYRISSDSKDFSPNKTPGIQYAYDMKDDYGYDGTDLFLVSDRQSLFNQNHQGLSGFAFTGCFPGGDDSSPMVQAAWLAYCSSNYFNIAGHQTGLDLASGFTAMTLPEYVTNQITYWPDSTLPQAITGWSRNWVVSRRTDSIQPIEPVVLHQYSNGYKSWKFTASDVVVIGNLKLPRQFTLESFYPKPPDTATTGDETEPLRKVTFTAQSIEVGKGKFDPLPPVSVPDLSIMDNRFHDISGNFVIKSHATPAGWPTRSSKAFKAAAAEANRIAAENHDFIKSKLK